MDQPPTKASKTLPVLIIIVVAFLVVALVGYFLFVKGANTNKTVCSSINDYDTCNSRTNCVSVVTSTCNTEWLRVQKCGEQSDGPCLDGFIFERCIDLVCEEVVNNTIVSTNTASNTNTAIDTSGWQVYNYDSQYHNFSLDIPSHWEYIKASEHNTERQPLLTVYDAQGNTAEQMTISYYKNPSENLNEWVNEHKQELVQGHEDIIDTETDYTKEDRIIVAAEMKNVFKKMHCYVGVGNKVYELHFFSEIDNWLDYQRLFNRACSTFRAADNFIDTSDWLTYENEEYGYSIKYPEDWNFLEPIQPASALFIFSPAKDPNDSWAWRNIEILVLENPNSLSIEEYYDSSNNKFDIYNDASGGIEDVVINDLNAKRFNTVLGEIGGDIIVINKGDKIYEITIVTHTNDEKSLGYELISEEIVKTFQLVD